MQLQFWLLQTSKLLGGTYCTAAYTHVSTTEQGSKCLWSRKTQYFDMILGIEGGGGDYLSGHAGIPDQVH